MSYDSVPMVGSSGQMVSAPSGYEETVFCSKDQKGNVTGLSENNGTALKVPFYSTDSSGNVTGLVGPNGTPTNITNVNGFPTVRNNIAGYSNSKRIVRGGYNFYSYTDHTALAQSGETAGYTLSTVSGVNGIAYDSSGSKTGSTAMVKLVVSGQAGAANSIIASASNMNLTMLDNKFGLWMYYSPDSTWSNPNIDLLFSASNSFPGSADWDISFNANQIKPGWNFLVVKLDNATHPYGISRINGSESYATNQLKKFGIYMKVTAGQTATMYFDTYWNNFYTKPAVMLGIDGTYGTDMQTYDVPTLAKYGLQGYVMLSAQATGDNTRWTNFTTRVAAADYAYANGWDICNHTLNHTNTSTGTQPLMTPTLTTEQLQYQLTAQTQYQLAMGFDRGREFYASPQGKWDVTSMAQIKAAGFLMQRCGLNSTNNQLTPAGYAQPQNMGWVSLDNPPGGLTTAYLATWQALIQPCIDYGADIWIGWHQVIAGTGNMSSYTNNSIQIYSDQLDALCAWLAGLQSAGTIVVGTPTQIYYNIKS